MLTLKLLREQPEFVIERLAVKNFDATEIVAQILEHDKSDRIGFCFGSVKDKIKRDWFAYAVGPKRTG